VVPGWRGEHWREHGRSGFYAPIDRLLRLAKLVDGVFVLIAAVAGVDVPSSWGPLWVSLAVRSRLGVYGVLTVSR
ncbi:hypothetical protein B8W95_13855, partial [Staphylococcus pasteuri]